MTDRPTENDPSAAALLQENAYLRRRNAQLQDDVTALSAEAARLRQMIERTHAIQSRPNPLGGGQ